LLVTAALRSDAGGTQTELVDGDFATACGPIACFVALRRIGCEANLESLAEQCGWSPGRTTSFRLVAETLSKHGVRVRPVRISAEQLAEFLDRGDMAAILVIRNPESEIDHVACAVEHDEQFYRIVDYPEISAWIDMTTLMNLWTGEAILVSRPQSMSPSSAVMLGTLPGLFLAFLVVLLARVSKYIVAQTPTALILACLQTAGWSCDSVASEQTATLNSNLTQMLHFDFPPCEVGHVVEIPVLLKNESSSDIRFERIRPSCGCISVVSHPKILKKGASDNFTIRLDTKAQFGKQKQSLFIESR